MMNRTRTAHARHMLVLAAVAVALLFGTQNAFADTPTPTPTVTATQTATATPTQTVTPTPTRTPKVPLHHQRTSERSVSGNAAADIAAPRLVTLYSQPGAVTSQTGAVKVITGNDYTIRGVILSAVAMTTSGSVTLSIDGAAILTTETFVAGKASYIELNTRVPAGAVLTLDIASSGLSGATVWLDTTP